MNPNEHKFLSNEITAICAASNFNSCSLVFIHGSKQKTPPAMPAGFESFQCD
jgi:hypothetical protein